MKTFMQLTLNSSVEESVYRNVWDVKSCGEKDIQNFRDANMLMWDLVFVFVFLICGKVIWLLSWRIRAFVDGKNK